jgi:adenylate kinase family enzyme
MKNALPKVIFMCGGPGSGKGTQAELIKGKFTVHHQNTGELLRAEVAKGDALGKEIKKVQDEGKLVSSELVVEMLKKNI